MSRYDSPAGPPDGTPSAVLDDRTLLERLRRMWLRRDPAPEGLARAVLARLAVEGLGEEHELLALVDAAGRLAGVRGASDDRTLTFAGSAVTIALRVVARGDGRVRVDGWLSPPAVRTVRLTSAGGELLTTSSPLGRFEFGDVARGTATCHLDPPDLAPGAPAGRAGDPTPLRLVTPPFTL